MRKTIVLSVLVAVVLGFAVSAAAQPRVRIAVLRFEDNTPQHWWDSRNLGDAAADVFVTELVSAGTFSVIERNRLNDVLAEHNLAASGAVTPQSAVELGRLLGVQLMVLGSITEFGYERYGGRITSRFRGQMYRYTCAIDIRVVNVETTEILYANREGSSHIDVGIGIGGVSGGRESDFGRVAASTMRGAVEKLVEELATQAADMSSYQGFGRVARVSGEQVYINRGTNDAVEVGDVFQVWRLGEPIIDPDTGQTLGQEEEMVGSIEVVSVQARLSICRLVSGGAQQGDLIRQ